MARLGWSMSGLLVLTVVFASAGRAATVCSTDTLASDFAAGSGDCYLAEVADGEVVLAPTEGGEFSGVFPPTGWGSFTWDPSGTVSVGSGAVTVNGAIARTNASYPAGPAGRSLEFVATFAAGPFQHVGFGNTDDNNDLGNQTFNSPPWAIFSTKNDGVQLWARIWNVGGSMLDFPVGASCVSSDIDNGTCLGRPHHYRIDWTTGALEFFIDGALVHHEDVTITGSMRPAVSDATLDGAVLSADWLRMTPYGLSCQFESRVFDGGNAGADWSSLTASSALPAGTDITIETRTGNTLPLGGPYQAVSGTTIGSSTARYLQYRLTLSTSDPNQTPELDATEACYDSCTPTAEICNGVDDDCDGQIDETFPDLGTACTAGVGDCEATGMKVCSPDHTGTVCDATPGTPTTEDLRRSRQQLQRHGRRGQSGQRRRVQHEPAGRVWAGHGAMRERSAHVRAQRRPIR